MYKNIQNASEISSNTNSFLIWNVFQREHLIQSAKNIVILIHINMSIPVDKGVENMWLKFRGEPMKIVNVLFTIPYNMSQAN